MDNQNNNYLKIEEDFEDDESNSEDTTLPYKSLHNQSTGSLKRYGSFSNLNALSDEKEKSESESQPVIEAAVVEKPPQPIMSWANRATTFVVQKVALFERIGETMPYTSLLDGLVLSLAKFDIND